MSVEHDLTLASLDHVGALGPQLSMCATLSKDAGSIMSLKEYLLELSVLHDRSDDSNISIIGTIGDSVAQFYCQHLTGSSSLYVLALLFVRVVMLPGSPLNHPRIGRYALQLHHVRAQWLQALNVLQAIHASVCQSLCCSYTDVVRAFESDVEPGSASRANIFIATGLQHCLVEDWGALSDDHALLPIDVALPMQLAYAVYAQSQSSRRDCSGSLGLSTHAVVGPAPSTSRVFGSAVAFHGNATLFRRCHDCCQGSDISIGNGRVAAFNFGMINYHSDNATSWQVSTEISIADIGGVAWDTRDMLEKSKLKLLLTVHDISVLMCMNTTATEDARRLYTLCSEVCDEIGVLLLPIPADTLIAYCNHLHLELVDSLEELCELSEANRSPNLLPLAVCGDIRLHVYEAGEGDSSASDESYLFVLQIILPDVSSHISSHDNQTSQPAVPIVVVVCHINAALCSALTDRLKRCLRRLQMVLPTGTAAGSGLVPGAGVIEICCHMCIDEVINKAHLVGIRDGPKGDNYAVVVQTQRESLSGVAVGSPRRREEFDHLVEVLEVERPLRALQATLWHFVSIIHRNSGAALTDVQGFDAARADVSALLATHIPDDSTMLWERLSGLDRTLVISAFPSAIKTADFSDAYADASFPVLDVSDIKLAVMRRSVKLARDVVCSWR